MLSNIMLIQNKDEIKPVLIKWIVAFISIISLDYMWFKFNNSYNLNINNFNYFSAIIAWLLLSLALTIHSPLTWKDAAIYGLYIGLIIYGIYNSTNYAIMDGKWPLKIALLDTIWGMTLCTIVSVLLFFIFKRD